MRLIRGYHAVPHSCKRAVVAIGNFDGVHPGHRAILASARRLASEQGYPAAVMSFTPHPRMVLAADAAPLTLTPFHEKFTLLRRESMDCFYLLSFDDAFAALTAEDFIRRVLVAALGVAHVVVGHDFIFGRGRGGDGSYLRQQAERLGFGITQAAAVCGPDGKPYSSSRIRDLLRQGDMAAARAWLGRPFSVSGHVRRGEQRGTALGFPTANLAVAHRFCPAYGVYAVIAETPQGLRGGVANLGVRPTFGGEHPWLEAHLFDFDGDLYGKRLDVQLLTFLRPERRFDGLAALRAQIAEDAAQARMLLAAGEEARYGS